MGVGPLRAQLVSARIQQRRRSRDRRSQACFSWLPLIARGSAGKDSVKVFGIALGFHQSLAPAIGTSGKIAQRGVAAIESADDRFGLNARFMYRTIAEIDELFGMTNGPGRTPTPFVAVIGGTGRVTSD